MSGRIVLGFKNGKRLPPLWQMRLPACLPDGRCGSLSRKSPTTRQKTKRELLFTMKFAGESRLLARSDRTPKTI